MCCVTNGAKKYVRKHMVQRRRNNAALRDVQTELRKECVSCIMHGAKKKKKKKKCTFEGCISNAQGKEGVCQRHRSKGINAINIPTLPPIANVTVIPAIPHPAVNYEDDE